MDRTKILTIILVLKSLFGSADMAMSAQETSAVTGMVTYTTSRSVYVRLDKPVVITEGDSVNVGLSPSLFSLARVKSISSGKVVLDRTDALANAEVDQIVYFDTQARSLLPPVGQVPEAGFQNTRFRMPDIPLDGRVSIQYYRYRGDNESIVYDQPSIYVDLGVGGSSSPLALDIRFRSRVQRTLDLPDNRDMADKRTDRLYDLAATYRNSGLMITLGRTRRIGEIGMGGMGGLDGVIGEYRIRDTLTGGVFLGIAPELDNFIGDRRETKNGAYIVWTEKGDISYETAIAYIHRNERDGPQTGTIYFGQRYSRNGTFRVNGEAVIVATRDNTGASEIPEDKRLQNARAFIGWTVAKWLRISANYAGYLVREYRDLNGLFDPLDIIRYEHIHTIQSRIELIMPYAVTISGETLVGENHNRKTDILSSAIRGRMANMLDTGMAAGMSYVQTHQKIDVGQHFLMNLSRSISMVQCSVSGGISRYNRAHRDDVISQRLQLSMFVQPGRRLYASAQATRNWDERIKANTFFLEIGTRFGSSVR